MLIVLLNVSLSTMGAVPRVVDLKIKAEKLLAQAISFIRKEGADKACAAFASQEQWRYGPITLLVLDANGRILLDEHQTILTWRPYSRKQGYVSSVVSSLLFAAIKGGWVAHRLFNSMRHIYVKSVTVEGKTYIMGASFFDESPELIAIAMARKIERLWRSVGFNKAIELVNNPFGPASVGQVYGIVFGTAGVCWAFSNNNVLVGQNLFGARTVSAQSAYNFKYILNLLKAEPQKKIWVDVKENELLHRFYCQLFTDDKTNKDYVLITGYYPDINDQTIINIGEQVATDLTAGGLERIKTLSRQKDLRLTPANLTLTVTDRQGVMLYHSAPNQGTWFTGRNILDYVDDRKRPYSRMLMQKLQKAPSAWITRFNKRTIERVYGRKIPMPNGDVYIFIDGYFPSTDEEVTRILVDDAYDYLAENPSIQAFNAFMSRDCFFMQGEKQIFVYDKTGACWVKGTNSAFIWSQDKLIPALAEGWAEDKRSSNIKRMYIRKLTKQNTSQQKEEFIIGSSYYLVK